MSGSRKKSNLTEKIENEENQHLDNRKNSKAQNDPKKSIKVNLKKKNYYKVKIN